MRTYTIEEARRVVMNCAKQYDKNLRDKQYMIIFKNGKTNEIQYIEVQFKDTNYQHLTGMKEISDNSYVPSSALLEDIKKLTTNQSQVIAIFSKDASEQVFVKIRYVAKGVSLNRIKFSSSILEIINLKNYISK